MLTKQKRKLYVYIKLKKYLYVQKKHIEREKDTLMKKKKKIHIYQFYRIKQMGQSFSFSIIYLDIFLLDSNREKITIAFFIHNHFSHGFSGHFFFVLWKSLHWFSCDFFWLDVLRFLLEFNRLFDWLVLLDLNGSFKKWQFHFI